MLRKPNLLRLIQRLYFRDGYEEMLMDKLDIGVICNQPHLESLGLLLH